MSDFKAKMHQIRFRLGLRPRPRWGSLQRSPRPLAGFEGPPTSKGGEGMRGEGGEWRGDKKGGEERGGRRREGRGGLSGNVAEEAFCLKSAPDSGRLIILFASVRVITLETWYTFVEIKEQIGGLSVYISGNRLITFYDDWILRYVQVQCDMEQFWWQV